MTKILYFTHPMEDYLADSVLHGLRNTPQVEVVDFPKKDVMYKNYDPTAQLYGNGFTLFRTLDDLELDRENIQQKLNDRYFDIVIFSSIHRQTDYFNKFYKQLDPKNTVLLDGEDEDLLFTEARGFRSLLKSFFNQKARQLWYFKRELYRDPKEYPFKKLFPISFGIPAEKITIAAQDKKKDFPEHLVDKELSEALSRVNGNAYKFSREVDYYRDLQQSRFGITTKKAGWDCMRHYEIAANGSVICFRNLSEKPSYSAPHGLIAGKNCIAYSNTQDLQNQLRQLTEDQYAELKVQTTAWIQSKRTTDIAKFILTTVQP